LNTNALAKKATFWGAVALTSIIAQHALEVLAAKTSSPGLARFAAVTHRGVN
jgi:hypothetical protein